MTCLPRVLVHQVRERRVQAYQRPARHRLQPLLPAGCLREGEDQLLPRRVVPLVRRAHALPPAADHAAQIVRGAARAEEPARAQAGRRRGRPHVDVRGPASDLLLRALYRDRHRLLLLVDRAGDAAPRRASPRPLAPARTPAPPRAPQAPRGRSHPPARRAARCSWRRNTSRPRRRRPTRCASPSEGSRRATTRGPAQALGARRRPSRWWSRSRSRSRARTRGRTSRPRGRGDNFHDGAHDDASSWSPQEVRPAPGSWSDGRDVACVVSARMDPH